MIQVIEKTLPFGKLAEDFGRSLGEGMSGQMQKEMTSNRLTKLSDQLNDSDGMTNLQLYNEVSRIPGMNPQEAQQLMPLLRESMQRENLRRRGQPGEAQGQELQQQDQYNPDLVDKTMSIDLRKPDNAPVEVANRNNTVQMLGFDPKTLTTVDAVELARQELPIVTEDLIDQRAGQLIETDPMRFPTVESARTFAEKSLNQEVQKRQAILDRRQRELKLTEDFRQDFDTRLSQQLGGNAKGELDRAYGRILDITESWVGAGKYTPESAAKRGVKMAEDFRKSQQALESLGTETIFGAPSEKMQQQLVNSRKAYEETNSLDLFSDTLVNQNGLSPQMASAITWPPEKKLQNEITKLERYSPGYKSKAAKIAASSVSPIASELAFSKIDNVKQQKDSRKAAENIVQYISPNESIYSVALGFNNKGLDENVFFDVLQEQVNSGKFEPSQQQQLELTQREPIEFSLADIFFSSVSGLFGKSAQTSFGKKLARTVFKKR